MLSQVPRSRAVRLLRTSEYISSTLYIQRSICCAVHRIRSEPIHHCLRPRVWLAAVAAARPSEAVALGCMVSHQETFRWRLWYSIPRTKRCQNRWISDLTCVLAAPRVVKYEISVLLIYPLYERVLTHPRDMSTDRPMPLVAQEAYAR